MTDQTINVCSAVDATMIRLLQARPIISFGATNPYLGGATEQNDFLADLAQQFGAQAGGIALMALEKAVRTGQYIKHGGVTHGDLHLGKRMDTTMYIPAPVISKG